MLSEAISSPKVLCSVPSIHSRKPPLGQFFLPILQNALDNNNNNNNTNNRNNNSDTPINQNNNEEREIHCLELFARNLTAGWTSWGNEVIYYQQKTLFETEDDE